MIVILALFACATDRTTDILALTGDTAAGETVFADNCAACHGADGTGGTGSDLTSESEEAEELVEVVLYGEDDMEGFEETLSDQEIADVVAYVQSISTGEDDEDDDD